MATGSFGQNHETMQALLKEQVGSFSKQSHSRTFAQYDSHNVPASTANYIVLETPYFRTDWALKVSCSPRILHANYIYTDGSESAFPSSGAVKIPDGVISCELSLVSCTILSSSWDPVDLLYFLLKERYVAAQFDSSFDDSTPSTHLTIENIRVKSTSTFTSSGRRSRMSLAQYPEIREINRSIVTNTSSIGSFVTACSQWSFVSPRSSNGNSAFFSVGGYDSAMIGTIREDETPSSGLSAPLAQLHDDYYTTLREQDIIQPFEKELNWSGKGQHVTFSDGGVVPLRSISHLGASMSATVDKVICRRIALARKTMRCNRRWTVADAMREVYHLQNLRHFHIVQLVGTYLRGRNFSILMYPAADTHLGSFLEDTSDMDEYDSSERRAFLISTLGCLTSAVAFIHQHTTKHMDIKPRNILIRDTRQGTSDPDWRVYIADFGLSRSFASKDHSQTDGPTSLTPRYCAPEVYNFEERGRSADIFSLGCVFLEILTVICCIDLHKFAAVRRGKSDDESFHANLERVFEWAHSMLKISPPIQKKNSRETLQDSVLEEVTNVVTTMIIREPFKRPTAAELHNSLEATLCGTPFFRNSCCRSPPEPYEAHTVSDIQET